MKITEDYINGISPDALSTKNANKILSKTKWLVKKSDRAIWSEIYGSGKKPYLTQIDSENIAFKCSCPSRKFPCKHGLALGLYIAKNGIDNLSKEDEPLWVKEWIDKRESKAKTKADKPAPKEKSVEVIKKENDKKWNNTVANVGIVELWLQDVVKMGILDFPSKEYAYWEELKKRMVDVKLTGFNNYFSLLQTLNYGQDWEQKVLTILSQMHLLTQSVKNHDSFSEDFKTELGFSLGWSVSRQEMLKHDKTVVVEDKWIVVKVFLSENAGLTTRKVYLYGTTTNEWKYILEFSHGNSYFEDSYKEGSIIQAKLMLYDGIFKSRAYVKVKGADEEFDKALLQPFKSLEDANDAFKDIKMLFPWVFEYPQFVASCNVLEKDKRFYLIDKSDTLLALYGFSMEKYFELISQSKGEFFDVFCMHTREGIELLGFYQDERVVSL